MKWRKFAACWTMERFHAQTILVRRLAPDICNYLKEHGFLRRWSRLRSFSEIPVNEGLPIILNFSTSLYYLPTHNRGIAAKCRLWDFQYCPSIVPTETLRPSKAYFSNVSVVAAEVIVSPPFVFIPLVKSLLRADFQIAAQNCWVKKGGAFTGEIRFHL